MTKRPVFRRRSALRDIREAVIYYSREAGLQVATRFVASLEKAYRTIEETPGSGSPRYGRELGVAGLRTLHMSRFPYLIFYKVHDDRIEVWRVLHDRRDIATAFDGRAGLPEPLA